jgi:hypothetical protein
MEQVANVAQKKTIATGMFIHANPGDPIHHGKGEVTVYNDAVHLHADFEVGPGPAYHVYLVPIDTVTPTPRGGKDHVRRPRAPARLQGQPGLRDSAGPGPEKISQCGDLV